MEDTNAKFVKKKRNAAAAFKRVMYDEDIDKTRLGVMLESTLPALLMACTRLEQQQECIRELDKFARHFKTCASWEKDIIPGKGFVRRNCNCGYESAIAKAEEFVK